MNEFNTQEIERILGLPDVESDEGIRKEIFGVIYSLGRDAENVLHLRGCGGVIGGGGTTGKMDLATLRHLAGR